MIALGCRPPSGDLAGFTTARTGSELSRFLGGYPSRCIPAEPGFELCEWQLGDQHEAWKPLARSVPTRRRLNVICRLPLDGSDRTASSCGVHPRESQHFDPDDPISPSRAAQARLDGAPDLATLAHLVGALPTRCRMVLGGRVCSWQVSNRDAGHALVAAAADTRGPVQLECRFAEDVGAKAARSSRCIASAR